jgi:hypothetical protein
MLGHHLHAATNDRLPASAPFTRPECRERKLCQASALTLTRNPHQRRLHESHIHIQAYTQFQSREKPKPRKMHILDNFKLTNNIKKRFLTRQTVQTEELYPHKPENNFDLVLPTVGFLPLLVDANDLWRINGLCIPMATRSK